MTSEEKQVIDPMTEPKIEEELGRGRKNRTESPLKTPRTRMKAEGKEEKEICFDGKVEKDPKIKI